MRLFFANRHWQLIGFGLALFASLAVNLVQGVVHHQLLHQTLQEKEPEQVYTTPTALQQDAYTGASRWLWHPEPRGIARQRATMQPLAKPEFATWLKQIPPTKGTVNRVAALLNFYLKNRTQMVSQIFPEFAEGGVYCDENAAIFRNILMRRGIQSRTVVFQFDDGDGGDSHTALEVWMPGTQTWAYVDPHYGAFDQRSVLDIMLSQTPPTALIPQNQAALNEVFTKGVHEVVYESYAPRQRIIYRAPKA